MSTKTGLVEQLYMAAGRYRSENWQKNSSLSLVFAVLGVFLKINPSPMAVFDVLFTEVTQGNFTSDFVKTAKAYVSNWYLWTSYMLLLLVAPPRYANLFVHRGKTNFTRLHFKQRLSPKMFSSLRITYVLPSLHVVVGGAPPFY